MRKTIEKSQVPEFKPKSPIAFLNHGGLQYQPMANKKQFKSKAGKPIQLRANPQDVAIIQAGMRKFGLDQCQILRIALRKLAEAEGLKAS